MGCSWLHKESRFCLIRPEGVPRFLRQCGEPRLNHGNHAVKRRFRRRVADTLLHLHAQTSDDPAASIQLARDDMAAMVGTAPESLIRTLSEFNHSGLIELTPKHIRVLEPEKLRRAHW